MPWCEECAKYWTPNAMNDDGTCPRCGDQVEEAHISDDDAATSDEEKVPWHFKLLVVAVVVYLGWCVVQLIG